MVEAQQSTNKSVQHSFKSDQDLSHQPRPRFLRKKEVLERTGLKVSTMYAYIKHGRFPRPIKPGGPGTRNSFWIEQEIEHWIANCVSQRNSAINRL